MSEVLIALAAVAALGALVGGLALARPTLSRMAARNLRRRKGRVAIAILGLLVGTAIISSSLVVGDTLNHIFVQNVYERLDLVDELVADEFNDNLRSFDAANVSVLRAGLLDRRSPVDGVAPALVKVMPVRNINGSAGNQQVTAFAIDDDQEAGFGDLVGLNGRTLRVADLPPLFAYVNERAAGELNVSLGDVLSLFYGTTNETIVHRRVDAVVRNEGKANWELRPIVFMSLADAQAAFNETGRVNLIRISNTGGVAEGAAHSDRVTEDARRVIALEGIPYLRVFPVKQEELEDARQFGEDATELFLVMGAFSVVAGLLLIVNIFVMMAEERKPEMGVSRAIGLQRSHLTTAFLLEGTAIALAAAAVGSLVGLALGYAMVYVFGQVVPLEEGIRVVFYFQPSSLVLAFAAGTLMTFASVAIASWRISRLNVVRAIRDLPEPEGRHTRLLLALGVLMAAGGAAAALYGFLADEGLGKIAGVPLVAFGLACLAAIRVPARWPMTAAGAVDLGWHLGPWHFVNVSETNVAYLFVAIGLLLVLGGIVVAVFNAAPALKAGIVAGSRRRGRPAARVAMSYPTERPFRTGMTLAMFALIMFMVTVISMVQALQGASIQQFIQQQSGGYDIVGYTQAYGEIPDFRQKLRDNASEFHIPPPGTSTMDLFLGGERGVSSATVIPAKAETPDGDGPYDYTLWGIDNFLVESNEYAFHEHLPWIRDANGTRVDLVTREDVWRALSLNHSYAVVDRSASGVSQFVAPGGGLQVSPGEEVIVSDARNTSVRLIILGVLEQALQFTSGIFADQAVVKGTFNVSDTFTAYFFQIAPGVDVPQFRADLERVFFPYGLQTIDIREEIGRAFDASQQVLSLMQAYLGIGLMVGIAGLGVVTARAVVERRQQVGALRAIGFTRRMVLQAFLLEIAFIALLGTLVGVALGVVLAYKVYTVFFADFATFAIPWLNLAGITVLTLAATIAATASPAVRASKIPPAEALRYIE